MSSGTTVFGGECEPRSWLRALARGFRKKCPDCGRGGLFDGYIRTKPSCPACGTDLSGHRADDAPPYITILAIGHTAIPAALAVKQLFDPPLWSQFAIWAPVMVLSAAFLLPASKGALIGLQWANRMHGFAEEEQKTPAAA